MSAAEDARVLPTLRYPAGDQDSPKPTHLYSDSRSGDIFLADASSDRIAIYDQQRRFNFEFSTQNRLASPRQLAVDSLGRIFVLGDTREHSLAVFDYNGEFLNYLDLFASESRIAPHAFALDFDDNLYALTLEPLQVHQFNTDGVLLKHFYLMAEEDSAVRFTPIVGSFTVQAEKFVLPLSMIGSVAVMNLTGELSKSYGYFGGGPGELSFPVAAAALPDGSFAILDKHRHMVQFLDHDGIVQVEMGYCGLEEGSFFHPTAMVVCTDGSLIVGQDYENRIQQVVFQEPPVASGP